MGHARPSKNAVPLLDEVEVQWWSEWLSRSTETKQNQEYKPFYDEPPMGYYWLGEEELNEYFG